MIKRQLLLINLIVFVQLSFAQTSWTGTANTKWKDNDNWTEGVPDKNTDAIIGDGNFTGSYQPEIKGSTAKCKSLTLGNGGSFSELTVLSNLNVYGNLLIGTNGTIQHNGNNRSITITGNWENHGSYASSGTNVEVVFSGSSQSITGVSNFDLLTVNSGSTLILVNSITVQGELAITGIFDPDNNAVSGSGNLTVASGGTLLVKLENFTENYPISGIISLDKSSTVEYASASIDQNVSSDFTYGTLAISGGTVKNLVADLPPLYSSKSYQGTIDIKQGTFDLKTYTADRGSSSGGNFIIAAGATLKIGGTNSFPQNYNTKSLASTSTVEYYGTNQSVLATGYGNLTLSSSSGVAVKTMSSSSFYVTGNFMSSVGSGTGVTINTANDINFYGTFSLDAGSTFNAGSYYYEFKDHWENNGVFNGETSIVRFLGVNLAITGDGTTLFKDVHFSRTGITASGLTNIEVTGDLYVDWGGDFTHTGGATLTMSGTSKEIKCNDINLSDLTITGTINATGNVNLSGNLLVDGILTTSNWRTFKMDGSAKTISGTGDINLFRLNIEGTITTDRGFTIESDFNVASTGSFLATNGTITFDGSTSFSGTADLFNITIHSSKYIRMGSKSVLKIANDFTNNGSLITTSNTPNTIVYNSTGNQAIVNTTYHNLILDQGGIKTPAGNLNINNDLTINAGVTLNASSYSITVKRNFINDGVFTPATSTIEMAGNYSSHISGQTTFNILKINKALSSTCVTLYNNISVSDLTMTSGNINTDTNTVTITNTRTGAGIIIGTITRNHTFLDATSYYFEGLNNYLTFTSPSGSLNSVTMKVDVGFVNDFDNSKECVTRKYTVTIPSGTYTSAAFSFHYEDNEVNAFVEPNLSLYRYNTGTSVWDSIGATSRNTTSNYVNRTGITDVSSSWVLSGLRNVVRWNGSISSAWNNASNWTTISGSDMSNRVPNSSDAAQIGFDNFTYNPEISTTETVNVLRFGDVQGSALTINSGSLSTIGGARGIWSTDADHTLDVASGTLNVATNLVLSDNTTNHFIHLTIGSGSANIVYDIDMNTYGSISFTGNGILNIGKNFNYIQGTFSGGNGTVIYSGNLPQIVAPVNYYHLSFDKSAEQAIINEPTVVNGDFTMSSASEVEINDTLSVVGNITIGAGTSLSESGTLINVRGNWQNDGTFVPSGGTVCFNGYSSQAVNASRFGTLKVDKSGGTLSLSDNLIITNDFTISSGTVDLLTYEANRSTFGGNLDLGANSTLMISGAANFPGNYSTFNLNPSSTVEYNGTVSQSIDSIVYGNIVFSNGGINVKQFTGATQINGDFTIQSGATIEPDSNSITLYGNFINQGTFNPSTSTLILNGTSKTFTGSTTLNNLNILTGLYTVTSGSVYLNGSLFVDALGSMNFGGTDVTIDGDLTNKGTLQSSGVATFTGLQVQKIQLLNAISSTSTGIINFNGSVAPIISSTSSPNFATVNINNTAGITPSVPWNVFVDFNVPAGASFNAGALTHTFYGNFTNNGSFESSGLIRFLPVPPYSGGASITLDGVSFISSGTIEFGGSVPITIIDDSPDFNNVSITNTNSAGITLPGAWYIGNNLYIKEGSILKGGTGLTHIISQGLTNNGTFEGQSSTVIFNGTPSMIDGSGINNFNHLTIDISSALELNSGVNIAGDFTNNGTFAPNGRTVVFNGTTPSSIGGLTSPIVFDDIEQDKTLNSTTLDVPVIINNSLTMTNGIIHTSLTNLLTLVDDATSTEGDVTSFIDGPVKKIGNDSFVFPVGNNSVWGRIGISAPGSVSDEFVAEYSNAPYSNTSDVSAPLDNVSTIEHWLLERAVGTSNIAATLFWEDGSRSHINNLADLRVAHFNGTNWVNETQDGGTTGTVTSGSVTSQTVSSFSPFTFGSLSAGLNPLPVEWFNFSANYNKGAVNLVWETASEKNNDYFTIEKSKEGKEFLPIGKINGAGNSLAMNHYSFTDKNPYEGTNYYKIKQTDFDGNYKFSDIVSVYASSTSFSNIQVFPNPVSINGTINIKFDLIDTDIITIVINGSLGNELFKMSYPTSGFSATKTLSIPLTQTSIDKPGEYYVVIKGAALMDKKMIMVK